ncbi:MAG: hypothetical protein GY716_22275 [bacterium]|nr:hypothetical protein [bacterium]
MNVQQRFAALLVCCAVTAAAAEELPRVPELPAAIERLVWARPFVVEDGYRPGADGRSLFSHGTFAVVRVDSALLLPVQSNQAKLFSSAGPAHRMNLGYPGTHLVLLIPGAVDPASTRLWLDAVERLDAAGVLASRRRAQRRGLGGVAEAEVRSALAAGGEPLVVEDTAELLKRVASLVERYSPHEKRLIRSLRGLPPAE